MNTPKEEVLEKSGLRHKNTKMPVCNTVYYTAGSFFLFLSFFSQPSHVSLLV